MPFPKLPYNLGTLLNHTEMSFRAGKNLIPVKLPFSLNIYDPISDRIYGSLGYEVICRSYADYQTVLLRTTDIVSSTFSVEMDGTGLGTVQINIDEFNTKLLESGHEADILLDEENIWELRYDGNLWFNWLSSNAKIIDVADNEVKSISISGPGVGEVLKWAMVLPNSFSLKNPLFINKLETFTDDSSGERLNTQTWNKSSADNVVISSSSARQDAEAEIEEFSGNLKEITQDIIDSTKEVKDAKVEYELAVKDDAKTDAEKQAALATYNSKKQQQKNLMNAVNSGSVGSKKRQLADANASVAAALATYQARAKSASFSETEKKEAYAAWVKEQELLAKLQEELDYNINHLEGARDKLKLALPDSFDGHTRIRLSIPNVGSSKVIAAGPFDFKDSGISAVVEPVPMTYTAGQAFTYFKVAYNEQNYVALFTEHTGIMRIRAEICNNESSHILGYEYTPKNMAWWRIREDDGHVWLEVSPDGVKWNDLNQGDITWPTGEVTFSFSANLTGFVGIEPPLAAYISQINGIELPPAKTPVEKLIKYVDQAKSRNVIPMVNLDFTALVDSYGATWNTNAPEVDFEDGTNLYSVTEAVAQAHSSNWRMTPDFELHLYQYDYPSNIPDPTVAFHKEDKVIFHTSGSIRYKERNRVRDSIANYLVGRAADGSAAVAENLASQIRFNKRELYINANNAKDITVLGKMLNAYLLQSKDEKSSWRVSVDPHLVNRRVFKDYGVGDWVAIESVDANGKVTKDVWRVMAISGSISSQGDEAVELTLQSRIDIFIETVKRQLERLNTSGGGSGGTGSALVSGAVAAAVLTGGSLEDLENVVIADPQVGDTLIWTGSYFTNKKSGDLTVPSPPAISSVLSNVYYPANDTVTRAQAQLAWSIPTNSDGSTVTDGHHYEIRYRPTTALPYQVTWNAAQETTWNTLYQWEQVTTPPMDNTGWQTIYVPWGDNSAIIQELTPGVKYTFQIRAVDIASPQNFSPWSVEVQHSVAVDNLAPPQPAPPIVYASRISAQVTHNLGAQSGGTFNLPPDMDHLEVHVGPDAGFVPSDSTKVGKLNANAGIIQAKTPVVATFQIEETDAVWVRVVAVDKTGNKSSPSPAATVTANLIDNAHISDLTVSKITAGELSANVILSSSIKTASSGARAEMNNEGFQTYAEDGTQTISLAGDPEAFDPGISYVGVGGVVAGTTSLTPPHPAGGTSDSLNLLVVTSKPASVDVTTPAGWDLVDYATNGEEISSEDLGSVRVSVFSLVGNPAGTVSVSIPSATASSAFIERWSKTSAGAWNVEQYSKSGDASDGANFFAFGDSALSLRDNDYLTGFIGVNSDAGTLTYLGFSAGGVNIVNAALRVNTPFTSGDDGRVIAFDGKVFDGYSFEPPYVVYENTSSQSGTVFLLRLSVNDLSSTNFVSIKNRGKTVASIDRDGRGSFQEVTVSGNFFLQGEDLAANIRNKPLGAVAYGESAVEVVGAGAALSRGWMELAFEAEAGRRYSVNLLVAAKSSVANDSMLFVIRDGLDGDPAEPFPASVYLAEARSPFPGAAESVAVIAAEIFLPELTTGTHRLLVLFRGFSGLATINPTTPAAFLGGTGTSKMWVEDKGLVLSNVGVLNDGNIPASGGTSSTAPKPPAAKPKTRRTYKYACTWSGTYRENNGYSPSRGSQMQQGDLGDAYHGNAKSLMGFDWNKIMTDLAGATIISCKLTMHANHWWNNSGGTAKIGTHNYTSRPATWAASKVKGSRVLKGNWPKPGQRTVDLGTTIGNDFKSGVAKGLALGPASAAKEFAGRFNGYGMDKAPILEIVFVK